MAMSKAEKNARARARYAEKKAAGNLAKGRTGRGAVMRFPNYGPEQFPTVKHGPRYGGEGHQLGKIGPHPGPFRKRRKSKAAALPAPAPVKRARSRVKSAPKASKRYGVLGGLIGPSKPRKSRAKKA